MTPAQKKRVEEAQAVLKSLGLPQDQQNERAALVLLALLGIRPADTWADAKTPLMGVTPTMKFIGEHYGVEYAPNTRETIRKATLHQFVDGGVALLNPDNPKRAVNSPHNCYQVAPGVLEALRQYGGPGWNAAIAKHVDESGSLAERYRQEREMARIPVTLPDGRVISLTPGGQNVLVAEIMAHFAQIFAPGAQVLYLGDTGNKDAVYEREALAQIGVTLDDHGKIPDVVLYMPERGWLFLIEAVTSHGPVSPKRRAELRSLFGDAKVTGLVYVTAFLDKSAFAKYFSQIAWETEVWIASDPEHMIHFNGERFLGPYE